MHTNRAFSGKLFIIVLKKFRWGGDAPSPDPTSANSIAIAVFGAKHGIEGHIH
jgi:hypothetical protein